MYTMPLGVSCSSLWACTAFVANAWATRISPYANIRPVQFIEKGQSSFEKKGDKVVPLPDVATGMASGRTVHMRHQLPPLDEPGPGTTTPRPDHHSHLTAPYS